MKTYNKFWTLHSIKKWLKDHFENGVECPACGQNVKVYKRKLNSGMAYFLINLYKLNKKDPENYFHASNVLGKSFSMDYAVLRHWKLIEEKPNDDKTKRKSGYWKITDQGKDFVKGLISVRTHVHLYNNHVVGFSDENLDIETALGNKFNYKELLS